MRLISLIAAISIVPACMHAQGAMVDAHRAGPTVGVGYGVTQSRMHTGAALSFEAGMPIARMELLELRGEVLYQRGDASGFGCERLGHRYCMGSSDLNQILGAGAALHFTLGQFGPIEFSAPIGAGLYQRRTRTTETEGPIELCVQDGQIASCPGNPPMQSITYHTRALVPGYSIGFRLRTQVGGVRTYLDMRAHALVERDSRAGAVPFTIGIAF